MTPPLSADELFAAAQALTDPAARAAYLDVACAGNATLRQEVDSLLAAAGRAGAFLESPVTGAVEMLRDARSPAGNPLPEKAGDRIGRYKLLEQIGEGGFGVVWMAGQEEPVRRRVALKIIKLGMDTTEVVARFEAERQALAMMDHPNIAIVLDGGATDTGRPFFVMELVKGIPLTDYCDANKLSTRERLELFLQVCQAVQHAHQKGVIHRDLKPSNILVTVKDDRPVPKVIDFGVAKATQALLTGKTAFTRFHQWIGTPAYMSPEQAGLGSLDVDTRSDVYSLGVVLYELLTGHPPFDPQKLLAAGYDAVMRTIREEEPPKPSTRLSTLAKADLGTVAAKRGAEPGKLGRLVRGDLDWIVMKALEKDRTRRYETAASLARDLGHYLNQEPASAAAPTIRYRLTKFARRNRVGLSTAALCLLLVLAGASVSLWQAVRATRAAAEAEKGRQRADEQTAIAAAVNEFLQQDLLARAVPQSEAEEKAEPDLKVRTVLDRASEKITGRFGNQPLVEASVRATMASAYHDLGLYVTQELHARRAAELYARELGETNAQALRMMAALGDAERHLGRGMEAVRQLQHVREIEERVFGPAHTNTLRTMNLLGVAYAKAGQSDQGEALLKEALRRAEGGPAAGNVMVGELLNNLAILLADEGRFAEAEQVCRRDLVRARERGGQSQLFTLRSTFHLATVLLQEQKFPEAETQFREAIALSGKLLGTNEDDGTLSANLGLVLFGQNKLGEAETVLRETLALRRARLSPDDPAIAWVLTKLARVFAEGKRPAEAEPLLNEALDILKRQPQMDDANYSETAVARVVALQAQGKHAELASAAKDLQDFLKLRPASAPDTIAPRAMLSAVLAERGQLAEGEALMFASWQAAACAALPDPQRILDPAAKPLSAEQVLAKLAPLIAAATGTNHASDLALWARAALYGRQGRSQEAAADLARCCELDDDLLALPLVPLWMDSGDTSGYERYRQQLSVRYNHSLGQTKRGPIIYVPGKGWEPKFAGDPDPATVAGAVLALTIYPKAQSYRNAPSLAEFAVERGTNNARLPHFQMVLGLAEYRFGRFESAAEWARRSLAGTGVEPPTTVMANAVLAMAKRQLHQSAEATQALQQAQELLRTNLPPVKDGTPDLGENWPDWLAARLLVKEAASPDLVPAASPPAAAKVNGEAIGEAEVQRAMRAPEAPLRRRFLPDQPDEFQRRLEQLQRDTVEHLIDRELTVQEFDREGQAVQPRRIDQVINGKIAKDYDGETNIFLKVLEADGRTPDQFRAQLEKDWINAWMRQREVGHLPALTAEAVEQYYGAHPAEFTRPESVELSMIMIARSPTNAPATVGTRRELAEAIRARLAGGGDFAAEAKLHSDGSLAREGGYMGWVERSVLRKEVADAAFALPPGGLSPVVETDTHFFILRVQGRRPSRLQPLSAVAEQIRASLERQQREAAEEHWLTTLRTNAKIERFAPPSN